MSKRGIVAGSRATSKDPNTPATTTPGTGISPLLAQYQQFTLGSGNQYEPLPRAAAEFLLGQFGPLAPQQPMPIDEPQGDLNRPEPRRWQYPVAWNMPNSPPGSEGLKLTDFQTLRTYADLYSVARSCIQVRKNEIRGIEWDIIPTKEAEKKMRGDPKAHQDFGERREKVLKFFKKPDPDYQNFSSWIDALLEDHFVVDAMSLYLHPSRVKGKGVLGSDLAALDIIDGTTIRPLLNLQGGKPAAPSPAYQQYLQGIPRVDLMTLLAGEDLKDMQEPARQYRGDQLLYMPYTARSWTPYGFPAVERTIVPILTGLRKQQYQLDYFDEGTLPGAFVSPGENSGWTPDQIKTFQNGLNAIAGDPAWKHKIVALPPGSRVDPQRPGPLADQFDEIVVAMVCMGFDVQPQELGVTPRAGASSMGGASQMAKASEDTQERKATKPLLWWLKTAIFDEVIQNALHQEDMQFIFEGLEEGEDEATKTGVIKDQISSALLSIDEGRSELGKSPWGLPETSDPGIMTATGFTPLGQYNPMTEQPGPQPGEPDPNAPPPGMAPPPGSPPGTPPSPPPIQTIGPGNKPPAPPPPPGAQGEAAAKPAAKKPAASANKVMSADHSSLLKPMLAELDSLARHLNKGRDISTWECKFITQDHLDLVGQLMEMGQQPSDAIDRLATHVEKTWNVVYDESKHPRGAGGRFGTTNDGLYGGSNNGAIAVSYSGKAPPKGPKGKKPKKGKKGKKKKGGLQQVTRNTKKPPKTRLQSAQSSNAKLPPPKANDPIAWEMYDTWYNQQAGKSLVGKGGVPHTADTPADEEIAERGRQYWRTHVAWGKPGDFMECVRGVMEHAGMSEAHAKGYCNLRHHEVTGEYAGPHAHGKMAMPDARELKLVEIAVGKAVPGARTEHRPPKVGAPRDNRNRFRQRSGRPGEQGAFAPGENDRQHMIHDPLKVGSEHDMEDLDTHEVDRRRHVAPGEDGHDPNPGGKGIPPARDDAAQGGQQAMRNAIEFHEKEGAAGTGNLPEDVAIAPKALMPGQVTRDFPGWRYDRQLAAHYAAQLAAADDVLVDSQGIAESWLGVHKAAGDKTPPGGDPRPWIAQRIIAWRMALQGRLAQLWREGWFLGARSARSIASTRAVDWGDWTPGNPTAARIVRTAEDLDRWLRTYGVATIRSIENTRMNELAAALHTSLDEGWSVDRLARQIEDVLVNPSRARMIANTETARAVSQGTLAEYRHAGVERVLWVSSEDERVCPTCDANEALGAVPMGSVFSGTHTDAPPGHPNCRCAVVAVPDGMVVPPREVTKFSPAKVHDKLSDHYPDKVLDWVKDAAWSDPTEIKLKHIDMARRPGGRDMKKVRSMAREIKAGKKMKPIYLVDTPSAPPLVIADGYHRALAHQHAGKQTILAHVASVDEEHGPWDRAMHDAKLNKVGPKGYEHNWVFVGVPGTGGRVFHPHHGHGTVASHNGDSATVHFDSGHKADFAAGHSSGPPRLEPKFDDGSFTPADGWKRLEIRGGKPGKLTWQNGQRAPEGLDHELGHEVYRMTIGGVQSRVARLLRSGSEPTDADVFQMNPGTAAEYTKSIKDIVAKMDEAIARGSLSQDTELWRTMQLSDEQAGQFVPGFEFGDLSYTSTSMVRSGAELVEKEKTKYQRKTGTLDSSKRWVMFRVLASKGQHATYGDTHTKIKEVVLPRGSKFRVVDVAPDGTVSVVVS